MNRTHWEFHFAALRRSLVALAVLCLASVSGCVVNPVPTPYDETAPPNKGQGDNDGNRGTTGGGGGDANGEPNGAVDGDSDAVAPPVNVTESDASGDGGAGSGDGGRVGADGGRAP